MCTERVPGFVGHLYFSDEKSTTDEIGSNNKNDTIHQLDKFDFLSFSSTEL